MKLVSPEARVASTGRTRTMTERIMALSPTTPDLVDGGFVFGLSVLALFGFATTFDSYEFLLVGALGVLLGMITAHLAAVLRWHWLTVILLVIVEFFLLGGLIAPQGETIAGFIPSLGSITGLGTLAIGGWKDLLTTLPPVAGDGPFVVLPYLMGLVAGSLGFRIARRTRRLAIATLTPLALLSVVILLGTLRPAGVLLQGLGFAVLGFCWLAVRYRRRRRLSGTGRSNLTTVWTGTAMVAVAAAGSTLLGGFLPGADTTRFVLRSYVQPPVELNDLASPLVGFRKYSAKGDRTFRDQSLLKVDGAPAGSLLRIAVLDDYSGRAWTATGGAGPDGGFQRLGKEIPNQGAGTPVTATITVLPAFSAAGELGPWVPSLGAATTISFQGANSKLHAATFRYNLASSQGVLADRDRLQDGDVVTISSIPTPQTLDAGATPGAEPQLPSTAFGFLSVTAQKWGGEEQDPLKRLRAIEAHLKEGAWSDGTAPGEEQYYPGHGVGRLVQFVNGAQLVGSDEQYAATLGLLCNQLGFPARVVFGAVVPAGGEVQGHNITAWVEVQTGDGWRAIPPAEFIPTKRPDKVPQQADKDQHATYVPPPNPTRLPGSFDQLADSDLAGTKTDGGWLSALGRWALTILVFAGPPIGVIVALLGSIATAKLLRRRRRRTRGTASTRVAAGWAELLDQAKDMGVVVPARATRLEQSRAIGSHLVGVLAESANTATFGEEAPADHDAASYWTSVLATRRAMLATLGRGRRFLARYSLRSLLPDRVAVVQLPKVAVARRSWLHLPRRSAVAATVQQIKE